MRILQNHTERAAQIRLFDLVDVDIIVPDLAVLNIVKTVDQIGNRCFAGSGGADERDFLSGLREKRYVMQYRLVRRITEVDVVEGDLAALARISCRSVCRVIMFPRPDTGTFRTLCERSVRRFFRADKFDIPLVFFGCLVHHFENAVRTGEGHDDRVHLLRKCRASVKRNRSGQAPRRSLRTVHTRCCRGFRSPAS